MCLHTEISSPFKLQELILVCSFFSTHRISLIMPLQTPVSAGQYPLLRGMNTAPLGCFSKEGLWEAASCSYQLYVNSVFTLTSLLFLFVFFNSHLIFNFLIYVYSSIYLFIFGCAASMQHRLFSS